MTIKKGLLLIITTTIMFIGNLMTIYEIDPNNVENKWIYFFSISIFLVLIGFTRMLYKIVNIGYQTVTKDKLKLILMWEIFLALIFYSKHLHGTFNLLEFVFYSILVPLTFFSSDIYKYKNIFLISYLVSIIPILYLVRPNNPGNNLGILVCFGGIVLLNLLVIKKARNSLIYLTMILFTILVFFTQSRSALVAIIVVITIHYISSAAKDNSSLLSLSKKLFVALLTLILVLLSYRTILNLFFYKWGNNQDITSGRIEFWRSLFKNDITLFGKGEGFFILHYKLRDAHNSFLEVLGTYGLISFIIYIFIFVFILFKSIQFMKIEYISFFVGFIILGQFENLFFIDSRLIAIQLLFFMYLGCLTRERVNVPIK